MSNQKTTFSYGEEFKLRIQKSDTKIAKSIATLSATERGQSALKDLKRVFSGSASGLDSVGAKAMLTLVQEFIVNHRRGFLL